MQLPERFREQMRWMLKEEFGDYITSLSTLSYNGIRVNTLKISPEEFQTIAPFPITRVPWCENGFYTEAASQPAKHPYYYAGLYYIQEPSAMAPASMLPVEPGDCVLDLCAAPGGKSTALGEKLKGKGLLVANDLSSTRAKALLKNIELFGISNALVISEAPEKLCDRFPEAFDKILVDAPCSGEGMFRRDPSMIKNWEEKGTDYYAEVQRGILDSAVRMLKPGGMLLYSTCTFSPQENEGTVQYVLDHFPEFSVVPVEVPKDVDCGKPEWVNGSVQLKNCLRLWPFRIKGEGHFAALLKKSSSDRTVSGQSVFSGALEPDKYPAADEVRSFFRSFPKLSEQCTEDRILIRDRQVYLLPENMPALKGLRVLRSGLHLGALKKNRFEPAQACAMALSYHQEVSVRFAQDSREVVKYLKCETIPAEQDKKGWQLVCVDEFPLGWAKAMDGLLKNKYYPGWRWQ